MVAEKHGNTQLQPQKHDQAESEAAASPHEDGIYQIKVKGHLDEQWSDWLGGLAITHDDQGNTLLSGLIPDQAALHGILVQIRDRGLPLLSLARAETEVSD